MNIRKFSFITVLLIYTIFGTSASIAQNGTDIRLRVKRGDILAQLNENDTWGIVKILQVDRLSENTQIAHSLIFNNTTSKPDLSSIETLAIYIYHAPIAAESYTNGWQVIGNLPPTETELSGFIEFLKYTNFVRYAEYTQQDTHAIISEANLNYNQANKLLDQGNRRGAISLYAKAFELFPLFFEAMDNSGFAYMELGNYENALNAFRTSLQVNPEGRKAFFSSGECLMALGRYSEALKIFEEGAVKFPQEKALFKQFHNKVLQLNSSKDN